MRLIDGEELRRLVPMTAAIDAVEAAFRSRDSTTPPREHVGFGDGELLFMPSWSPRAAGVKLVTVNPGNPERGVPLINGSYLLFDRTTLQPTALIDAAALTAIRTAAVSAVATRALARPDARRLAIFGAGAQAHAHLEAMAAVRDLSAVSVISRTAERAEVLAERARELVGAATVERANDAVAGADVVCTCTTSSTPVFEGRALGAEVHVNAVGSYKRSARELDTDVLSRAGLVVVENLEVRLESGDIALPVEEGTLDPDRIAALRDVLDREKPREPEVTVFKSVGQAFEDLAVAEVALAGFG